MKRETINKRFRAAALTAVLMALAVLATAVSCSKDTPPSPDNGTGEGVELHLTASLADDFGGAQADTKAPVMGKTFPAGVHRLSLAIFKADKHTKWAEGYDNILAEVNVNNTGTQTWRFQLKGSSVWQNALSFPTGTSGDMWVTALYPYDAAATIGTDPTASLHSNYDLTTAAQQADQSDVMYVEPTKLTIAAGDLSRAVLLSFKHLFVMFEFQIAPIFNDASKITKILVHNSTEDIWIRSKGTVGTANNSTTFFHTIFSGVSVTDNRAMTMGVYNTYRVMFQGRPDLASYADGEITVDFTDGLNPTVTPLPLQIKKEWILATNGLKAGCRYTFKMLYHNNLVGESKLEVTDWSVNGSLIDGWGVGAPSDAMLYWSCGSLVKSGPLNNGMPTTITNATQSSYNGYTYNASNANNNGGYKGTVAEALTEPPFYQLEVAKTDESSEAVTWEDAWALCALKTTDGGGWRLPRMSELVLCRFNNAGLITADGYTDFISSNEIYWSATEASKNGTEGHSWRVMPGVGTSVLPVQMGVTGSPNASSGVVRCVRELPRQAPPRLAATKGYLDWHHPETLKQGIVDNDTFAVKGTIKSYNGNTHNASNANNNGGYIATNLNALAEPVYYKLEVAKTDQTAPAGTAGWSANGTAANWTTAWDACKAKAPAGAWRLPRQSELAWIYINKTELEKTPGFTVLSDSYYWSSTERINTYSWYVSITNGTTNNNKKTVISYRVRCVREIVD